MASPPKRNALKLVWAEVKIKGERPSPRWGCAHCLCFDKLFVSGGCGKDRDTPTTSVCFADTWFLHPEGDGFKWEKLPAPPATFQPRFNHSATRIGDMIWIIGGQGKDVYYDDIFTFNLKTQHWQKVTLKAPADMLRRAGHCAIVAPDNPSKIVIFGGHSKQKNAMPQLVLFDTVTLTAVDFRTLGTKRLDRSYGLAFHLSESKVLFLGGADIETKTAVEGAACLNLDRRHWQEKYMNDESISHLIGARGIRYQRKIYIHGGRYMKEQPGCSSDLIEIGSGQLPPHCDIRLIQSEGLPGMMDHLLFLLGDWLYCLQGKGLHTVTDAKLFRANLGSLNEDARPARTSALPVPSITPLHSAAHELSATQPRRSISDPPRAPVATLVPTGAIPERNSHPQRPATTSSTTAGREAANGQTSQSTAMTAQPMHSLPTAAPTAPVTDAISHSLPHGTMETKIIAATCKGVETDGGDGTRATIRLTLESDLLLPGINTQSRDHFVAEIARLKQRELSLTAKNADLEKKMTERERHYEGLLLENRKENSRLKSELDAIQKEHEQAFSQIRAWFSDAPVGVSQDGSEGTSSAHAAKKVRRQ